MLLCEPLEPELIGSLELIWDCSIFHNCAYLPAYGLASVATIPLVMFATSAELPTVSVDATAARCRLILSISYNILLEIVSIIYYIL